MIILAKRDSMWMSPIYDYLNISNSFIQNDQTIEEKVKSYNNAMLYMEIIMNFVLTI
jgi:preprotein translocase subunit SecA